ncbi:unnamed protein product [Polarella glacialis]|uniref:RRM domain-containing protein n=1 Tax=Polarella glacialis TaxID=89957 RepID=A0A813D357_POLGL|nr:unnamed protein product [Polarella glacialis]
MPFMTGQQFLQSPTPPGFSVPPDCSVYLSEVPVEFTEASLQAFQASLGIYGMVSAKILARRTPGPTGSVIVKYQNPDLAWAAMSKLSGHPVKLSTGEMRHLIAKPAAPPKESVAPVDLNTSAWFDNTNAESTGNYDLLSLYLADLPSEFTQSDLEQIHQQFGAGLPSSVKILPPKVSGETCSAILRYETAEAAGNALRVLTGFTVNDRSGRQQVLTARYAAQKRFPGGEDWSRTGQTQYPAPALIQHRQHASGADSGGDSLPSVYVSDMPADLAEDGVRNILAQVGLDPASLVAVKFLPRKFQVQSVCVLLRYNDMASVNSAVAALSGFQVVLPDGNSRQLRARVADPPKSTSAPSLPGFGSSGASGFGSLGASGFGGGALGNAAPARDLYVAEVPVEWGKDNLISLHSEVGLEPSRVAQIKILPRRHEQFPTGAAIISYVDEVSAKTALGLLQDRPVYLQDGSQRQLKARFADPPKKR